MHPINETIVNYIGAWNETDPGRRRALIERTWSDDGTYLDAHREGTGHAAIDAMIAAVQQQFSGYRLLPRRHRDPPRPRAIQLERGRARPLRCTSAALISRPSRKTAGCGLSPALSTRCQRWPDVCFRPGPGCSGPGWEAFTCRR